jgi:hypothetical protein
VGAKLFGMLHKPPPGNNRRQAIILLSPGVKMRVAPHRLYNLMSQRYAHLGYSVLRFDFTGLGDSEGSIEERMAADFYGTVQVGRYVGDTIASMDWMEQTQGTQEFILAGLCGGAITGLLAGAEDTRMKGLLGLGIPVILDAAGVDHLRYVTDGQLHSLQKRYIDRLIKPDAWLRLLTLRSDYATILKVIRRMAGFPATQKGLTKATSEEGKEHGSYTASNFNKLFPRAILKVLQDSCKVLFIFSGGDRLLWEFREKFEPRWETDLRKLDTGYEVHTIEQANHILSLPRWREEMLQRSTEWLLQNFS